MPLARSVHSVQSAQLRALYASPAMSPLAAIAERRAAQPAESTAGMVAGRDDSHGFYTRLYMTLDTL